MSDEHLERVRSTLDEHGLLPVQDARAPSVCTLVAGEPVRGSWWGHPAGRAIFDLLGQLEHDCTSAKLLWGKVTLVHPRLWPALAAIGEEGAPWQFDGLGPEGRAALDRVQAGDVRSDHLGKGMGMVVTDLERRLLLVSESQHTEGGHHGRSLRTWARWLPDLERPAVADARRALEGAAESLGARAGLPW